MFRKGGLAQSPPCVSDMFLVLPVPDTLSAPSLSVSPLKCTFRAMFLIQPAMLRCQCGLRGWINYLRNKEVCLENVHVTRSAPELMNL